MDIQVDNITNDIIIEKGDFKLTELSTPEEVAQRVQLRLLTRRGEWFTDLRAGLPYAQELLAKGAQTGLLDDQVQSVVQTTEGVSGILSYSGVIDKTTRKYLIKIEGTTVRGEIFTIGANI